MSKRAQHFGIIAATLLAVTLIAVPSIRQNRFRAKVAEELTVAYLHALAGKAIVYYSVDGQFRRIETTWDQDLTAREFAHRLRDQVAITWRNERPEHRDWNFALQELRRLVKDRLIPSQQQKEVEEDDSSALEGVVLVRVKEESLWVLPAAPQPDEAWSRAKSAFENVKLLREAWNQ